MSGTAKAAAQTVLATQLASESKSGMWWVSNAMVLLSNSCDAAGRSSPICELATDIAGQESELSMGEMLSTSETLLRMLGDEASSR